METQLTLYEMAKQMVANEEVMDPILLNKEIAKITKNMKGKYYFMICPDNRQFVFFSMMPTACPEGFQRTLFTVLTNRGQVILIDDDNADKEIWEIYVKDKYTEEIYMYQLVNYTEQTIEVK